LEFGDAVVSVDLETKGVEHQQEVREILQNYGFSFKELQ
jgi:threonine dehydratase